MAWNLLNPFIRSGEVLRLIGTLGTFDFCCRPSEMMGIEDNYTAYCFDEACAFIVNQIRDGKEPVMRVENNHIAYKKPSDLYRKYEQQKQ